MPLLASLVFDSPTVPLGSYQRHLTLGERTFTYNLKCSSRRTIGSAADDRSLSIAVPCWVTLAEVEHIVAEKQKWIFARPTKWCTSAVRRILPTMGWQDDAGLSFLGKTITLKLESPIGVPASDADISMLHLGLSHITTE